MYLTSVPNPFNLLGPPAWFLAEMRAADADLVIFPSQEQAVYRIARKAPHGARSAFAYSFLQKRPDTRTYATHGLVPVTSLLPFVQWGPVVLSDLAEMDVRRAGGGAAAADLLERREREADQQLDAAIADRAAQEAAAAYRGAKWTGGDTLDLGASRVSASRPVDRTSPIYRPLNFAGGSAVFVGR